MKTLSKQEGEVWLTYYEGHDIVVCRLPTAQFGIRNISRAVYQQLSPVHFSNICSFPDAGNGYNIVPLSGTHSFPLRPVLVFDTCRFVISSKHDHDIVPVRITFFDGSLRDNEILRKYQIGIRFASDYSVAECACHDVFERNELSVCLRGKALVFDE